MTLLTLPRASIPLVDAKGNISREWFRWASDATARMGGVEGLGTEELTLSQFEDAGIEEAKHSIYRLSDDMGQLPPAVHVLADTDLTPPAVHVQTTPDAGPGIEELRAQVAELAKAVQALQQGLTA